MSDGCAANFLMQIVACTDTGPRRGIWTRLWWRVRNNSPFVFLWWTTVP